MTGSFSHLPKSLHAAIAASLLAVTFGAPLRAQEAPVPELQAAQQAVDRAGKADADQYAPDLIDAARQMLSQAQAAAAGGRSERRQAPQLAQRAAAQADLARARSDEAKVNAQVQQRREEIAELRRKLGMEDGQ